MGEEATKEQAEQTAEDRVFNVLFLCHGNAARSIMAECILNGDLKRRFKAYSAGNHPRGTVDPQVLDLLKQINYPTETLRSKSWDEFAKPDAPELDFVFTVCDRTAGEVCPAWPGQPMTAHWSVPDPLAFEGTPAERGAHIADVYRMLNTRISIFTELPIASLDRLALQARLDHIGSSKG